MMRARDVSEIVGRLNAGDVRVWLDGGWGVDALIGHQTRDHDDLDVVIPLPESDAARRVLTALGFEISEDERTLCFVARDPDDRRVDVHVVAFDDEGGGLQRQEDGTFWRYPPEGFSGVGSVDGREVACLSAETQILCHLNYEPDETDRRDMRLLAESRGMMLPAPTGNEARNGVAPFFGAGARADALSPPPGQDIVSGRRNIVLGTALLVSLTAAIAALSVACGTETRTESPDFSVLVFSRTAEYRHASITDGIAAVERLGQENNFAVEATEDAARFTDEDLERYDAVIFLNTTGDVLDPGQQAAFERYVRSGGGYVGVHAAADTEYRWAWYGGLVGAYFESHPQVQEAEVRVTDRTHPSTTGLPERWVRRDEWYNFRADPRDGVRVLAVLDEDSYSPGAGAMGSDHPISWCHDYDGGRAWYTGLGHTSGSYAEVPFLEHLLGGIKSAAGEAESGCGARDDSAVRTVPWRFGL